MKEARACLDELVGLYQSGPRERSSQLLEKIADLYFLTIEHQSIDEQNAFGEAMIRMLDTAELGARAQFAERFSDTAPAPIQMLRHLAEDDICVARPVLQFSPCLRDGDLISIAREAEETHLVAMAHRKRLTERMTNFLVQKGSNAVNTTLVRNVGAKLSPETAKIISEANSGDTELLAMLNARSDTAPGMLARLGSLVGGELWQDLLTTTPTAKLKKKNKKKPAQQKAKPPVKEKPQAATDEPETAVVPEPAEPLPRPEPEGFSPAGEKVLIQAANAGDAEEAVNIFSRLSGLEEAMVKHCLFEAQTSALMVLCKSNDLASSTFMVLMQLRERHTGLPIDDTGTMVRRYDAMTPETAQRVIKFADRVPASGEQEPDD